MNAPVEKTVEFLLSFFLFLFISFSLSLSLSLSLSFFSIVQCYVIARLPVGCRLVSLHNTFCNCVFSC